MPQVNRIVGVYLAGIPIACSVTIASGIPSCYGRNLEDIKTKAAFNEHLAKIKGKVNAHGHHSLVEGDFCEGDHIAIIDDLATKFDTKLVARGTNIGSSKGQKCKRHLQ